MLQCLHGEDGILNKAKTAKESTDVGNIEEQNKLGKTNDIMDSFFTTSRGSSFSDTIKYSSGMKTLSVTSTVTGQYIDEFTATADGFLLATASLYTYNQTSCSSIECAIVVNNTTIAHDQDAAPSNGSYRMTSAAGLSDVKKGDVIRAYYYGNAVGNYSYNYGYMFFPNS